MRTVQRLVFFLACLCLGVFIASPCEADILDKLSDCDGNYKFAELPEAVPHLIDGACPISKNRALRSRPVNQKYKVDNVPLMKLFSDYKEGLKFKGWEKISDVGKDSRGNVVSASHASGLYLELIPTINFKGVGEGTSAEQFFEVFTRPRTLEFTLIVSKE